MPPSNDSGSANLGTVIPTSWETALNDLREERYIESDRDNPPSKSEVIREAVELYLAVLKAQGALPTEAFDDVEGIDERSVLDEYGVETTGNTDIHIEEVADA